MKKILKEILITAIVLLIAIGIIYAIDLNRMKHNKKVLFSTWGRDYAPAEVIVQENPHYYSENYNNDSKTKIEDLPQDYSYIQAIQDKCIISMQGIKLFNKSELDKFLDKVHKNESYSIRCINYTVEGDMIITDVNFEGNNVFKTSQDSTRDNFSSKEDRIIRYGEYSKIITEEKDGTIWVYLTDEQQAKDLIFTVTYYNKDAKVINDYEFKYLLNVKRSDKVEVNKITQGELANKYNYDIYYYGLENVTIKIDNEEIDLKQALIEDKVTMEQIISEAERDKKNDVINGDMYKDGGTMMYWYGTYTIIKSNSLDGNKDVYIGIPEMNLNSVR